MSISDDQRKEKRDSLYWRGKIKNFEESKVNSGLTYLIFSGGGIEKIQPWYGEVLKMILFACSYAYREAYGWDNLTAKLYENLALELPKIEEITEPNEMSEQQEKLKEFVQFLPGEFQEAYVVNGVFRTADDEVIKQNDFEVLWTFMESEVFGKFTIKYISENMRK